MWVAAGFWLGANQLSRDLRGWEAYFPFFVSFALCCEHVWMSLDAPQIYTSFIFERQMVFKKQFALI